MGNGLKSLRPIVGLLSLLFFMGASGISLQEAFWGCIDPWDIGSGWSLCRNDKHDPQTCVDSCSKNALYVFAVFRGGQCCCGTRNSKTTSVDPTYCGMYCTQGAGFCGGNFGSSLFCTNSERKCPSLPPVRDDSSLRRVDPGAIYCLDAGCGQDFTVEPTNFRYGDMFPDLNPTDCINYCYTRNQSYAYLLYYENTPEEKQPYCRCSNESLEKVSNRCTVKCPLESQYYCGNVNASNVYCTTEKLDTLKCMSFQDFKVETALGIGHDCHTKTTTTTSAITTTTTLTSTTSITTASVTVDTTHSTTDNITGSVSLSSSTTTQTETGDDGSDSTDKTSRDSIVTTTVSEATVTRADVSSTMLIEPCDRGSCDESECFFEGNCYAMRQIGTPDSDIQISAESDCLSNYDNAHLVAINSQEEQDFLAKAFLDSARDVGYPSLLTSGYYYHAHLLADKMGWRFWGVNGDPLPLEVFAGGHFETDEPPAYLFLVKNDSVTIGYNEWVFKQSSLSEYFICEYTPAVISTTSSTTSATSTSSVPTTSPSCICESFDLHGNFWKGHSGELVRQACPFEAQGQATWYCAFDELNNPSSCRFESDSPDYNSCTSYWLVDVNNQISAEDNATNILNHISNSTSQGTYFGHEIEPILDAVEGSLDLHAKQASNLTCEDRFLAQDIITGQSLDVLDNLLDQNIPWQEIDQDARTKSGVKLVDVSENVGFHLLATIVDTYDFYNEDKPRNRIVLGLRVWNVSRHDISLRFPLEPGGSWLEVDNPSLQEVLASNQLRSVALQLIGDLEYIFPASHNELNFSHVRINSPILSLTLDKTGRTEWSRGNGSILLVFKHVLKAAHPYTRNIRRHLHEGESPTAVIHAAVCGYFEPSQGDSLWDKTGCSVVSTNSTHTICSCKHLTSFADLMDVHNYIGESLGLEVTTLICSSLSALGFIATFVAYGALKVPKTDRSTVTLNLCFCLFLSHLMVLTVFDKSYFNLPDTVCASMGVILHYVLLCSFAWMAVEGIYLYRLVVAVFQGSQNLLPYFYMFGYGMPFTIVAVTVAVALLTEPNGVIDAYSPGEMCWLRPGDYTWAFSGPVAAFLVVNAIFLVFALRSASFLQINRMKSVRNKLRGWIKGSLSLATLLGIGWLSGYLLMVDTDFFAYIFTIVNGLQGCFIFFFHCVLNDKVRVAYQRVTGKTSQASLTFKNAGEFQSSLKSKPRISRPEDTRDHSELAPPLPFLIKARGSASSQETQFTGSSGIVRIGDTSDRKAVLRSISGSMSIGSDFDALSTIQPSSCQRKSTRKRSVVFEDVYFARSPDFSEGAIEPNPPFSSDSSRLSISSNGSPIRRFATDSEREGTKHVVSISKVRGLDPLYESPANLY